MSLPSPKICRYIFLDEGGNLDFSAKGSRFFTMTGITMDPPFKIDTFLNDYKYDCINWGLNTECFHCAEDNSHVRAQVFSRIQSCLPSFRIDSLVIEKAKTGPALRTDERFYPEMLGYLLKYIVQREKTSYVDELVVITDKIPINRKRQAVEKAVKQTLSKVLPSGTRYRALHHASKAHFGLQLADYCNWAIWRKWEKDDTRFHELIRSSLRSEFDIFKNGTRYYY